MVSFAFSRIGLTILFLCSQAALCGARPLNWLYHNRTNQGKPRQQVSGKCPPQKARIYTVFRHFHVLFLFQRGIFPTIQVWFWAKNRTPTVAFPENFFSFLDIKKAGIEYYYHNQMFSLITCKGNAGSSDRLVVNAIMTDNTYNAQQFYMFLINCVTYGRIRHN